MLKTKELETNNNKGNTFFQQRKKNHEIINNYKQHSINNLLFYVICFLLFHELFEIYSDENKDMINCKYALMSISGLWIKPVFNKFHCKEVW